MKQSGIYRIFSYQNGRRQDIRITLTHITTSGRTRFVDKVNTKLNLPKVVFVLS